MNDEQIKQRIRYLVEHGGLWEDPMNEIRRMVSVNRVIAVLLVVLAVADLAGHFMK